MYQKVYFQLNLCLLLAICFFSSCSRTSRKVAIEDARKNIIAAEISQKEHPAEILQIQTVELYTFKAQPIYLLTKSFSEASRKDDNSRINTLYDGFGNKTEMRLLEKSDLLRCVVIKTSSTGNRYATVFGKNGEARRLPETLLDKALTADDFSLAAAVGIYEMPKLRQFPAGFTPNGDMNVVNAAFSATPLPTENMAASQEKMVANSKPEEEIETKTLEPAGEKLSKPAQETPKITVDSLLLNNLPAKKKAAANQSPIQP